MAYIPLLDISEIEGFFPNMEFNEKTSPTSFQVESWISEATALIYGSISDLYAIPVTDENDLEILKIPARAYVLEYVKFIAGQSLNNILDKKETQRHKAVNLGTFQYYIDLLKSESLRLVNSTKVADEVLGRSYNASNSVVPEFDFSEDNW